MTGSVRLSKAFGGSFESFGFETQAGVVDVLMYIPRSAHESIQ